MREPTGAAAPRVSLKHQNPTPHQQTQENRQQKAGSRNQAHLLLRKLAQQLFVCWQVGQAAVARGQRRQRDLVGGGRGQHHIPRAGGEQAGTCQVVGRLGMARQAGRVSAEGWTALAAAAGATRRHAACMPPAPAHTHTHQQIFFSTSCQRGASSWMEGVSYTALRGGGKGGVEGGVEVGGGWWVGRRRAAERWAQGRGRAAAAEPRLSPERLGQRRRAAAGAPCTARTTTNPHTHNNQPSKQAAH